MVKHKTKLIDGNFSPSRAKSILLELLAHKINFHGLEKFSNEIRFGEELDDSKERIKALTKEKLELTEWLNSLENTASIKVNCIIKLEVNN